MSTGCNGKPIAGPRNAVGGATNFAVAVGRPAAPHRFNGRRCILRFGELSGLGVNALWRRRSRDPASKLVVLRCGLRQVLIGGAVYWPPGFWCFLTASARRTSRSLRTLGVTSVLRKPRACPTPMPDEPGPRTGSVESADGLFEHMELGGLIVSGQERHLIMRQVARRPEFVAPLFHPLSDFRGSELRTRRPDYR